MPTAVMPANLFSWRQPPPENRPLQPVEVRASVRDSIDSACSMDANGWLVCILFTAMLVITFLAKQYGIWMPEGDVDRSLCTTGDEGCK